MPSLTLQARFSLRFGELGFVHFLKRFGVQQLRFHDLLIIAIGSHLGWAFVAADVLKVAEEEMLADLRLALAAVQTVLGPDQKTEFLIKIQSHLPAPPAGDADARRRAVVYFDILYYGELITLVFQQRQQTLGALQFHTAADLGQLRRLGFEEPAIQRDVDVVAVDDVNDGVFIATGIYLDDILVLRGQLYGRLSEERRGMTLQDKCALEFDLVGVNPTERLGAAVGLNGSLDQSASFVLRSSSPSGACQ